MKTKLISAAVILASLAAVGLGGEHGSRVPQPPPPRDARPDSGAAEKALRAYYGPTSRAQITSDFDVDGVRVFNATVDRDGAVAEATLTGAGDYISMGVPEPVNMLPPGVQETAQIYRTPPQSITREDIHAFFVTVKGTANRPYIFEFDATGRVRDIKTSEEIHADASAPRVGGAQGKHMMDLAASRFSGVQIEGVAQALHDPGFFMVPFRNQNGTGWAIMSENNDVTQWRYPMAMAGLPEAVRRSIQQNVAGDRIVNVTQGARQLYQLVQGVGSEEVTMLVEPNGDVSWMSSQELHRPTLRQPHQAVAPR